MRTPLHPPKSKTLQKGSFSTLLAWSSSPPAPGAGCWSLGTVSRAEVRWVRPLAMAAWLGQPGQGNNRCKSPNAGTSGVAGAQPGAVGGWGTMLLSWPQVGCAAAPSPSSHYEQLVILARNCCAHHSSRSMGTKFCSRGLGVLSTYCTGLGLPSPAGPPSSCCCTCCQAVGGG